jgi:hypothetical protein
MGEHAGFIAHLLDPGEQLQVAHATRFQTAFLQDGLREIEGRCYAGFSGSWSCE